MSKAKEVPQHIAIVMDGNGRWAKARGLKRSAGHRQGAKSLHKIIEASAKAGVKILSVFAFGADNWKRPQQEVDDLMQLFSESLKRDAPKLHKHNIQLKFIGDRSKFSDTLQTQLNDAEALTENNSGLTLITAVNYSGHWDVTQATQQLCEQVKQGQLEPASVTNELVQSYLSTSQYPNPDLLIRTSGEQRLSNFMMWQLAYTELYFTGQYWPDFGVEEFQQALAFFAGKERRFGCTSEQLQAE